MVTRYLLPFDLKKTAKEITDVLVIGSGVAGLYAALKAAEKGEVILLTKRKLEQCNSEFAQGGIAAAIDEGDSPDLHFDDTLKAGAGLCDPVNTEILVQNGPERIWDLIELGAHFDREGNQIALTREGAHSRRRILHAKGDATGEEIREALLRQVLNHPHIKVYEDAFVVDLITEKGVCYGANIFNGVTGQQKVYLAKATVLATGGAGYLYLNTTNPDVATGDGIAIAYRAGAALMDLEFVQFHPTALCLEGAPHFLISEAVRGEGGILRNVNGERFMPAYHQLAELAPRDIVARAIVTETEKTGSRCVYLDVTHLDCNMIKERFPTITKTCLQYGIDITKEYIPIAPAAHYMMGGIRTNGEGETEITGLYACGETACTGVHGANRLASNSLLEAVVFAGKVAAALVTRLTALSTEELAALQLAAAPRNNDCQDIDVPQLRMAIRRLMWEDVGIVRSGGSLANALEQLDTVFQPVLGCQFSKIEEFELQNMVMLGRLVVNAALLRHESRGGHYRTDYPHRDDSKWGKHIVLSTTGVSYQA